MCILLNENGTSIIALNIICGLSGHDLPWVVLVTHYTCLEVGEPEAERDLLGCGGTDRKDSMFHDTSLSDQEARAFPKVSLPNPMQALLSSP